MDLNFEYEGIFDPADLTEILVDEIKDKIDDFKISYIDVVEINWR